MTNVDIENKRTIKGTKYKANFHLMSIDLQNICIKCMMKVRMNFWLKVEFFIYLLLAIKGQHKGIRASMEKRIFKGFYLIRRKI